MTQRLTDSTVAATPNPTSAPTHTPTDRRTYSRRHSGQLVTTRLVERRDANVPMPYQRARLETIANTQRAVPPITGTPKSGSVGREATARMNPGAPRHADSLPTNNIAATRPNARAMPIGTNGPRRRTRCR